MDKSLKNLERLDLSYNKIEDIKPIKKLKECKELELICLNNNKIKEVDFNCDYPMFPKLKILRLDSNGQKGNLKKYHIYFEIKYSNWSNL